MYVVPSHTGQKRKWSSALGHLISILKRILQIREKRKWTEKKERDKKKRAERTKEKLREGDINVWRVREKKIDIGLDIGWREREEW